MYPLLLEANVKSALWGGNRLFDDYNIGEADKVGAEAYLLSTLKNKECSVKKGALEGNLLSGAISVLGKDFLGENAEKYENFPLVMSLIDAKDRLSLKVNTKSEFWYILEAGDDAKIVCGLNQRTNKYELERKIRNNRILEACNFYDVKKGDVLLIEAGTINAVGKGIVLLKIGESDSSHYRISDYGRLDLKGNPRPLNIAKALEVISLYPTKSPKLSLELTLYPFGLNQSYQNKDFLFLDILSLKDKAALLEEKSFISLFICEGEAVLSHASGNMRLKKGDSVLIPAKTRVTLTGVAEIVCAHI